MFSLLKMKIYFIEDENLFCFCILRYYDLPGGTASCLCVVYLFPLFQSFSISAIKFSTFDANPSSTHFCSGSVTLFFDPRVPYSSAVM